MDRAPPHRLPAPKEVTHRWDLNLSASFSSQDFSWFTRSRIVSRPPIRCLIPYRCCPGCFLFASAASYPTLPVHRSGPAMISMLKVQSVMLPTAVRYLTTPWAAHRGSLIATIPESTKRQRARRRERSLQIYDLRFED